jgi:hypothetical protein
MAARLDRNRCGARGHHYAARPPKIAKTEIDEASQAVTTRTEQLAFAAGRTLGVWRLGAQVVSRRLLRDDGLQHGADAVTQMPDNRRPGLGWVPRGDRLEYLPMRLVG